MSKQYTLDELVKSTWVRMAYNIQPAQAAINKPDNHSEFERFMNNAKDMLDDIAYAIDNNEPEVLMDNRDW